MKTEPLQYAMLGLVVLLLAFSVVQMYQIETVKAETAGESYAAQPVAARPAQSVLASQPAMVGGC